MKHGILLILVAQIFCGVVWAEFSGKCDAYLGAEKAGYQQWLQKENLSRLEWFLNELICEAQTKRVDARQVLSFFQKDAAFFRILNQVAGNHSVKDSQILKTVLILLKQGFHPVVLHPLLSRSAEKDFPQAFSRVSYFFLFAKSQGISLNPEDLSRLAAAFYGNQGDRSYLEMILSLLMELRNTGKDSRKVAEIFERAIKNHDSQRKIRQMLEEISN